MSKAKSYLSLIKFSHTIFAMPFALIGFVIGLTHISQQASDIGEPDTPFGVEELPSTLQTGILFLLVILCMVFARSAAMAFNRYLDRSFDAKNPRTAIREIPSGVIS